MEPEVSLPHSQEPATCPYPVRYGEYGKNYTVGLKEICPNEMFENYRRPCFNLSNTKV
jgi:hypothetical protein